MILNSSNLFKKVFLWMIFQVLMNNNKYFKNFYFYLILVLIKFQIEFNIYYIDQIISFVMMILILIEY